MFSTAGFAAGSIPIIGIEYLFLKSFIAILVAVLQAITIAFTFLDSKKSTASFIYFFTSSLGFVPYGALTLSA